MPVKLITFCGQPAAVACDGKCNKAWGINRRPREQLDPNDPDDEVLLADDELGEAPADPGTYEGDCGKPVSDDEKMNKWCVRECERSEMTDIQGRATRPPDLSRRYYNMAPHYREDS